MRAFLLFLLLMVAASVSEAATITFSFTNRITGQPLTNSVKFIPVTGPTMANGAVLTRGPAINITPNPTNGVGVVNLLQGHYLATNAHLGKGILFSVPLSSDTYTLQQLAISGYNTYVYNVGSNTFNTGFPLHIDEDLAGWNLTNGGFAGVFYGDGRWLTNLNLINATNNDLLFGLNATNNDILFGLNGTNHVLQIGQNATNNDLLLGFNSTNNTLAVGASLTNYVLLVGQNGTNYALSLFNTVSNTDLSSLSNYVLLVSQNATNEALLIGANGTNNTAALGSALTNGAILNLSNYVLLVSQNATNEALLIGLNGTNNLSGLGLAITNGAILNLSNYVLAISQNATNQALLIGQRGTNESLLIGLNATNNDTLVGLSITNGGLASLSNYVAAVSVNSTSEALLVGLNGTNNTTALGLSITNGGLSSLSNYVAGASSDATNNDLAIGLNVTNYVLEVGQNGTNYADYLFGTVPAGVWAITNDLIYPTANGSPYITGGPLVIGTNGTFLIGPNAYLDNNASNVYNIELTNQFAYSTPDISGLVMRGDSSHYVVPINAYSSPSDATIYGHAQILVAGNDAFTFTEAAPLTQYLPYSFYKLRSGISQPNASGTTMSYFLYAWGDNNSNSPIFSVDLLGNQYLTGTLAAATFYGDGSGLTNLNLGSLTNVNLVNATNNDLLFGLYATNQSLLIGADGSNNVIALGLSITNGGLAALSNYDNAIATQGSNNVIKLGQSITNGGLFALSNYVVTTSQNSTNALALVAFTGQLAASNVFAGGQLPLGTISTNSGVLGIGAFLTETGDKRAYSLNGGSLTNLQGANVTGTVGAATLASYVTAAILTNQYYASNASTSGGQFPMGTVAANTASDGWFLLNSNSTRLWGLNAGNLTNLNGTKLQTGTVNSNALDSATLALIGNGGGGGGGASVIYADCTTGQVSIALSSRVQTVIIKTNSANNLLITANGATNTVTGSLTWVDVVPYGTTNWQVRW